MCATLNYFVITLVILSNVSDKSCNPDLFVLERWPDRWPKYWPAGGARDRRQAHMKTVLRLPRKLNTWDSIELHGTVAPGITEWNLELEAEPDANGERNTPLLLKLNYDKKYVILAHTVNGRVTLGESGPQRYMPFKRGEPWMMTLVIMHNEIQMRCGQSYYEGIFLAPEHSLDKIHSIQLTSYDGQVQIKKLNYNFF